MRRIKNCLLAGLLALVGTSATAQSNLWSYQGSFYMFAAETKLDAGGISGELSFSDALDNLDFAAMAAFSASNGQWTFIADLMYFDLGFRNNTPGPAYSSLDTDSKTTIFNALALYNVQETPTYSLHLGAGVRYFDTDTTLTLRPGAQPQRQVSSKDSWTDPVVAALGRFKLSDQWSTTVAADYGSFVSDRETYQFTLTFDYEFSENWVARFGYRYVNVENDDNDFRFRQSGPLVGVSYKF